MTKRALIVGINDYPGTGSDLYGCVNDARDWSDALIRRGFEDQWMLLNHDATRESILGHLQSLLSTSKSGDLLVVCFSGHGTWIPGRSGDEPRDEAICPHDISQSGPITDDELFELFSRRGWGRRVVMVADSCYSGTLHRLAGPLSDQPRYVRFLPPEAWMGTPAIAEAKAYTARSLPSDLSASRQLRSGALVLAGCGERQVCWDARFNGRPNGAFTYAALKALLEAEDLVGDTLDYRMWMRVIRKYLPSRDFDQRPQLDGLGYQKDWPLLDDGGEG